MLSSYNAMIMSHHSVLFDTEFISISYAYEVHGSGYVVSLCEIGMPYNTLVGHVRS